MASEIDPKTKRKLTWDINRKSEKVIRMQGAKTSKTMLPCKHRVHFRTTPKQHKNDANLDPRIIEKTNNKRNIKNNMRKNIETNHPKYAKLSDIGSHLGACCSVLCGFDVFCLRHVLRNLWGYPFGSILASTSAPLVRFCRVVG